MSIEFSSEQRELQDMLRGFFREELPSTYLRQRIESEAESDPKLWAKLQALGLTESFGSVELDSRTGFRELGILAFESGFALLPEPLVDQLFSGPFLFEQVLSSAERRCVESVLGSELVAALSQGKKRCAVALGAEGQNLSLSNGKLSGQLSLVPSGHHSAAILLLERHSASTARVVIADAGGAARQSVSLLDGSLKACAISLSDAKAAELTGAPANRILQLVHVLRSLEMAGACLRAVEMTVEFVKVREQFGVPVGGFQAVQHRIADMYLQTEALGALGRFAAWSADHSQEQLALASASALVQALEQAAGVVEGAIQMHGGIGFTYEYDLHLFLRRVKCLEALYRLNEREYTSLLEVAS